MISGYFAYDNDEILIIRKLRKVCWVLLYGIIIFLLIRVIHDLRHESWRYMLTNIVLNLTSYKAIIKTFVFCTLDFAIPLWYLIAIIETYIMWKIIVRKKMEVRIIKIIPVLFALQLIIVTYCETMNIAWFFKVNFITSACPWFMTGYYFHTNQGNSIIRKCSFLFLLITSILGMSVALLPIVVDLKLKFSSIGVVPYAICIFMLALKYPNKRISETLEYIGKNLSLNVYILHMPIHSIVMFIMNHSVVKSSSYIIYKPIYIITFTLIICVIIRKISDIFAVKDKV